MQGPQGMEKCTRSSQKCTSWINLCCVCNKTEANSNIQPKKRKIVCCSAAPEINVGPLHHFQNRRLERHFTQCFQKDLLQSWQWNHNELNAQRDEVWVPPLVPMAKVKLNLLSAPLKLVSQDSEHSLPSITSAGTKRRFPEGVRDQSNLHSRSDHQGSTIPQRCSPFRCITAVIRMKHENGTD